MIGRKRSSAASRIAASALSPTLPSLDREVDHHDRVLFHDADQHHDADHGDDREVHLEHHQRDQRADAGRRQAGDDRDRMDEALVENAEHHVGGEDRRQHQDALPFERILEHLRGALEARGDRRRQARFALDLPGSRRRPVPSDEPGARLNEMVTAGWLPW